MTLQTQFKQELTKLGNGGRATLVAQDGPRHLACEVSECNSLAVSFTMLRLATSELASASVADLKRISLALSQRLTYLLEPISPIEIDAEACAVQLRSNPPQRDDDGRSYFELLVRRGGELALCRYHKDNGGTRQPVSATVTGEVLIRLVGDFDAVLDEAI